MEFEKPPIKPIAYNYGMYMALASVLFLIVGYALDMQRNTIISILSAITSITLYVLAFSAYKKLNGNVFSLGDAMKLGLAIAAIAGIIGAIYAYIHYGYIDTDFIQNIRVENENQMLENAGDMTEEQLETATKMTEIFTSSGFFSTMTLIGSLFFGVIISLIVGLIMKSDSNDY